MVERGASIRAVESCRVRQACAVGAPLPCSARLQLDSVVEMLRCVLCRGSQAQLKDLLAGCEDEVKRAVVAVRKVRRPAVQSGRCGRTPVEPNWRGRVYAALPSRRCVTCCMAANPVE